MEIAEVVVLYQHELISRDEARELLGSRLPQTNKSDLAEAERVLRVISGWNPARVSTAEAIQPAIDYFTPFTEPSVEDVGRGFGSLARKG